jgi:hypothetical protein
VRKRINPNSPESVASVVQSNILSVSYAERVPPYVHAALFAMNAAALPVDHFSTHSFNNYEIIVDT